ncbi:unnamed protein product [Notodromas monacha]|uniref:Uncharacterized protein n=1 Tax=Notodromas monacha TaxID=399045 RepID=A0A7R9BPJ9_9CRUS|nr:unnamed protein product [Notodromas monacha]CAG0919335.1 unnamed protein product [Notodromas monacha]
MEWSIRDYDRSIVVSYLLRAMIRILCSLRRVLKVVLCRECVVIILLRRLLPVAVVVGRSTAGCCSVWRRSGLVAAATAAMRKTAVAGTSSTAAAAANAPPVASMDGAQAATPTGTVAQIKTPASRRRVGDAGHCTAEVDTSPCGPAEFHVVPEFWEFIIR